VKGWSKRRGKGNTYRYEVRKHRLRRRAKATIKEVLTASLALSGIGIMAVLLIMGYLYLISHPYFAIREITVRGCKELTEQEILSLAAVKTRQNIFAISLRDVQKKIMVNPWIKDANVGRELPNRLIIDLRERTAVSLVKKDNSFYLMDINGVTFKKLEMNDEMDLPILTGYQGTDKDAQVLMGRTLGLLRYLSTATDFPNIKNISEINGNGRFGLSVFTNTGLWLHLGFDNYENKFRRLPPVMVDLERRYQKKEHLYIDLSDPVKITVQRRDILPPAVTSGARKEFKT
jgi:cell division protein FtsQ